MTKFSGHVREANARAQPPSSNGRVQSGAVLLDLQRLVGNAATSRLVQGIPLQRSAVTSQLTYSRDDEKVTTTFGDWFFWKLHEKAEDFGIQIKKDTNTKHLFIWDQSAMSPAKDLMHMRDNEHLHLINLGTDIDISTKTLGPGKTVLHHTGLEARAQDASMADQMASWGANPKDVDAMRERSHVSLCNKTVPPAGVEKWQVDLIGLLRDFIPVWLEEDGLYTAKLEFET